MDAEGRRFLKGLAIGGVAGIVLWALIIWTALRWWRVLL
jgi:hypothetical protein